MDLSLQELEAAINYWRAHSPAHGNELELSPEVSVLARVYALMISDGTSTLRLDQLDSTARHALQAWRERERLP